MRLFCGRAFRCRLGDRFRLTMPPSWTPMLNAVLEKGSPQGLSLPGFSGSAMRPLFPAATTRVTRPVKRQIQHQRLDVLGRRRTE